LKPSVSTASSSQLNLSLKRSGLTQRSLDLCLQLQIDYYNCCSIRGKMQSVSAHVMNANAVHCYDPLLWSSSSIKVHVRVRYLSLWGEIDSVLLVLCTNKSKRLLRVHAGDVYALYPEPPTHPRTMDCKGRARGGPLATHPQGTDTMSYHSQ